VSENAVSIFEKTRVTENDLQNSAWTSIGRFLSGVFRRYFGERIAAAVFTLRIFAARRRSNWWNHGTSKIRFSPISFTTQS